MRLLMQMLMGITVIWLCLGLLVILILGIGYPIYWCVYHDHVSLAIVIGITAFGALIGLSGELD